MRARPGEHPFDAARDPAAAALAPDAIAERYHAAIYRYILRRVHDPELAADLTQETFLRVHHGLDRLKDAGALEAWLYRVATNVCYDRFRQREHRRPALPLLLEQEPATSAADDGALRPDQLLEQNDMSECVLRVLAELPAPQREVLLLHDLQEFSAREIGEQLGLSVANVKIRLHRARARLRAALSDACDFTRNDRDVHVCEPKHR